MKKVNLTHEDDVKAIIDVVKFQYGYDIEMIRGSGRKQLLSICRSVIANIAKIDKGIHPTLIANTINRDRTSILHYFKNHKSSYSYWTEYRNAFNSIYDSYCKLREEQKTFVDVQDLRSYLFNHGIKFSDNPDLFIDIKMNDFVVSINSDYRNFSHNQELIRLALKDYNCKIEISFKNETVTK